MSWIIIPLPSHLSWAEYRRKVQAAKRMARITGRVVVLTKATEQPKEDDNDYLD